MVTNTYNKKLIFIFDDDVYLAEMVRQTLLAEGYSNVVFHDGIHLIDQIAEKHPDLILLDIKMPGMNGNEILQQIRKDFNTPVIMLTGLSSSDSIALSIELGADDYISKPFYPQELISRIKAKLRRYNVNH